MSVCFPEKLEGGMIFPWSHYTEGVRVGSHQEICSLDVWNNPGVGEFNARLTYVPLSVHGPSFVMKPAHGPISP